MFRLSNGRSISIYGLGALVSLTPSLCERVLVAADKNSTSTPVLTASDDSLEFEFALVFEEPENAPKEKSAAPQVEVKDFDPDQIDQESLEEPTPSDDAPHRTAVEYGEDTDNPAFASQQKAQERGDSTGPVAEENQRPVRRGVKPITIEPIRIDRNPSSSNPPVRSQDNRSTEIATNPAGSKPARSSPPTPPTEAAAPQAPQILDPAVALRASRVDATLRHYLTHPESVTVRSPWAVMHAILPYGKQTTLLAGSQQVNAIEWMCYNRICRTQTIFTPAGRSFRPNVGGGVQGHQGQFLAILAQSSVPSSQPLHVGRLPFTVEDLVKYEMATCKPKTELTFKLIGLSYYLGTQQTWRSQDRQLWNIERLVGEEMAQPVNGAACGGTHRLMGLSFALRQRRSESQPLSGHFARADRYIKDYVNYTWSLQNPDGSFSTNWFESRGYDPDNERKVQTTGHMLEWLLYTCDQSNFQPQRAAAAVDYLMGQIYDHRDHAWPIGPRGHALRALGLYRARFLAPAAVATTKAEAVKKR